MSSKRHAILVLAALAAIVSVGVISIEGHIRHVVDRQTQSAPVVQASDPLSGEWQATFYAEDNHKIPATFKLKLDGTTVSGTASSENTGEAAIRDGKWSNGELIFTVDFENHMTIIIHGVLRNGNLAGEAQHPEGGAFKWEAVRKQQ